MRPLPDRDERGLPAADLELVDVADERDDERERDDLAEPRAVPADARRLFAEAPVFVFLGMVNLRVFRAGQLTEFPLARILAQPRRGFTIR